MDVKTLIKDKARVMTALSTDELGTVTALEKIQVYVLKHFEQANLLDIGDSVTTLMCLGVVVGKYYSPLSELVWVNMGPGDITEETIDGDRYYVLHFEPGDTFIERTTVAMDNNIGYYAYMELTKFARLPWFANQDIIAQTYDSAGYFTGKSIGNMAQAIRAVYSLTCRDPDNIEIPFRYSDKLEDKTQSPKVIGVNNPGQLLTGIFSRIMGGYLNDNIIAGMLENNTEVSSLEEIMKGSLPNEE